MCDTHASLVVILVAIAATTGCIFTADPADESRDTSWQLGSDTDAADISPDTTSDPEDTGPIRDVEDRNDLGDTLRRDTGSRDTFSCESGNENLPDRCLCNFRGNSQGVCRDQLVGEAGCSRPDAYEESEVSCDDGVDNDCNGQTDGGDLDCRRAPGETCTADEDCMSGVCTTTDEGPLCAYRMFATEMQTDGNIGGLSAADELCNEAAQEADLGGQWRAVLSTESTSAANRLQFQPRTPFVNVQGDVVIPSEGGIWETGPCEDCADRLTGKGFPPPESVWTGTYKGGDFSGNACSGWTSNAPEEVGGFGKPASTGNEWMDLGGRERYCDEELALYCVDGQSPTD
jgi:hypothetical protein